MEGLEQSLAGGQVAVFPGDVCLCSILLFISQGVQTWKNLPVLLILNCKTNPLAFSHPLAACSHNWVNGSSSLEVDE